MSHDAYNKDTIDVKFNAVHERFSSQDKILEQILGQATKTNGRVSRLESVLKIVGTAVGVLLITNGSELVKFILSIL